MGSRVNEINKLTNTEATTVRPKGLNHSPETPGMKPTGMNTATIEKVVPATAMPISAVPFKAAVRRSEPRSMCRTMFSRTTMASSIKTPMAKDKPNKLMKLSVNPQSQTAMKAVMTDVGKDKAVISVERHEFKNTYTTKMVRPAPKINASTTLFRLFCASTPPSWVISSFVPSGRVLLTSATNFRISLATLTVDASRERVMAMPTLGLPLRMLKVVSSAKPSLTVAT